MDTILVTAKDCLCHRPENGLMDYCVICGKLLDFTSDEYITCGKPECEYKFDEFEFGVDNYVMNQIQASTSIVKFLLETSKSALLSNRRNDIFEPCPSKYTNNKDLKLGVVSALSDEKSIVKDYDGLLKCLGPFDINQLIDKIQHFKTDDDIISHYGHEFYSIIRFFIKTNKIQLIHSNLLSDIQNGNQLPNNIQEITQFMIKHGNDKENEFSSEFKKHGSLFLYHGSSYENWYSIMRNGIKICSGTKLMTAGKAYGSGVYLSDDINYSIRYSQGKHIVMGIFELINNPQHYKKTKEIYVVNDENMLLLRYILIIPNIRTVSSTIAQLLNIKFGKCEIENKAKAVNKISMARNRRLMGEYKKILQLDPAKLGFILEINDDELDIWNVYINDFYDNPGLLLELKKLHIPHIHVEIRFPETFPMKPPFARIVTPRFEYRTGHITEGGSFCTELLSNSGWSPMTSLENLIVNLKYLILEGGGHINPVNTMVPYDFKKAVESFHRVSVGHGWA
jgi:ubiquitin-protein ligase